MACHRRFSLEFKRQGPRFLEKRWGSIKARLLATLRADERRRIAGPPLRVPSFRRQL
jgi:hypothetical protein